MRNGGTALWQGFDIQWFGTPHRLKHLSSAIGDIEADDRGVRGVLRSHLTVGRVPDTGVVRTRVAGIRSRNLRFLEGEVDAHVEGELGGKAKFVGAPVEVPIGDAAPEATTIVLRGFQLGCTSHPGGIHPQGLSVGLTRIETRPGVLSFVPRAWVRANNSPDVVTTWRGGFAFELKLLYTVIAGRTAAVTIRDEPCVQVEHGRRAGAPQAGEIGGRGGFTRAAIGIRGFRWDQRHRSYFDRNGRFVRRLQAQLSDHDYDSTTGRCTFEPALRFSNAGLMPWPARSEHRLWTTLIEYDDDRPTVAPLLQEQRIATGLGEGAKSSGPFQLE